MKKNMYIIWILFFLFSMPVFSYQIIAKDINSYQFQNGKFIGKNTLFTAKYEIDLDAKLIKEVSANSDELGSTNMATDISNYKIISTANNQIVAVRIMPHGEEMLTLKEDGTFHFYQTLYMLYDIPQVKKGTFASVVSFGKYVKTL